MPPCFRPRDEGEGHHNHPVARLGHAGEGAIHLDHATAPFPFNDVGLSPRTVVAVGDQHLFLRAGDLLLSVKLNNVVFPPYKQVIPAAHKREVTVGRDELVGALRRAEVMAPEKTATVRLRLSAGTLELTADNPDLGVAHQELSVQLDGEPLEAGFNARYLMQALEVMDGEDVRLQFQNELDPCVIKPADDIDFLAVVMPMRI